jgi:hypothetical protein
VRDVIVSRSSNLFGSCLFVVDNQFAICKMNDWDCGSEAQTEERRWFALESGSTYLLNCANLEMSTNVDKFRLVT